MFQSSTNSDTHRLALWCHALALIIAVSLAGTWLVGELLPAAWPWSRLTLWLGCLILAGTSGAMICALLQRGSKHAIRSVKLLCQANYLDLDEQNSVRELIAPELGAGWAAALEQIGEHLRDQAVRLRDAEQARAKAEVKAKRLQGEHRQLKQILDGLQDPVLTIDSFNELNYVNESAAALFQLTPQPGETRALESLMRCEALVNLLVETNQHRAQTVRWTEAPIGGEAGAENWYRIRCRGLTGDDSESGSSSGAVAVLRDINEQKHMQRRNAEFVSAVSHEMKTPLTGIKAYVELLADGDAEDEETREEFLGVINSQADRLQRLVENMLDLARIEAGVVDVHKRQISLNEVLERALEVVAPAAEAKSIALAGELSPMYLGVLADHDMLLQAAINLLSNAIKYTPNGGQVTLRSRMLGGDIAFEVEDTGVGLSPDDCRRVFDKFYRVKKDKQMAPGTGLGLPLAKHIVEDVHGGRLEVESQEGVGSTFRVTLTEQTPVPALV